MAARAKAKRRGALNVTVDKGALSVTAKFSPPLTGFHNSVATQLDTSTFMNLYYLFEYTGLKMRAGERWRITLTRIPK